MSKNIDESNSKLIQFDWARHWKGKVKPHLRRRLVRGSVEMGMKLHDPRWTWRNGPHVIGRGSLNGQRVFQGKLSWYQPWGRCHWIAFFACSIGVLNYPHLDWQFICGDCHTVPVGSWNDKHRVVMDILNFRMMTAEESIAHAQLRSPNVSRRNRDGWRKVFACYIKEVVPRLLQQALVGHQ